MDRYSITARIYPMVIFYIPLSVLFIAVIWDIREYYHYGIPVGAVGVLAYLTAQLGRDAGKSKEAKLWRGWGGSPTSQLFRWRDTKIDKYTKAKSHNKMEQLCPISHTIDKTYELNNPVAADEVYRSWTAFIIGKTRDVGKYPLLFKENMSYGFRRNLWGLKPYALLLITALIVASYSYFAITTGDWRLSCLPTVFYVSEAFLVAWLLFWVVVVTKRWVSWPAFAYAERLHEAIDSL